jgi:nucleoid DNA-binding protein
MNEVVIGYCDFDRSTFSSIDTAAVREVREAIKRGARVTVTPSTDGFGSYEYNEKLQRRRAAEAISVIGATSSQADIELTPVPTYIASTPMERVEQRSVRVRILEVRP